MYAIKYNKKSFSKIFISFTYISINFNNCLLQNIVLYVQLKYLLLLMMIYLSNEAENCIDFTMMYVMNAPVVTFSDIIIIIFFCYNHNNLNFKIISFLTFRNR